MKIHHKPSSDDSHTENPSKTRRKTVFKWMRRIYVLLGVTLFIGMLIGYQAAGFDKAVLLSDDKISVTRDRDLLTFSPKRTAPSTALLFLPGAMVDPNAYAPMARAVAERGYRVSILSLPLRLAPSEGSVAGVMAKAASIIESDASIQHWVIAGHSKGGKLAVRFAHEHPDLLSGLILIGTSHPDQEFDLSHLPLDVTKVYATRDGLASPKEVEANRRFLPAQTHWICIEGGNHTQFGYYRFQLGDRTATINRQSQQRPLVKAILLALQRAGTAVSK
jgi:predicted alpha/beta-hydrolase family hydrolase